MIRIIASGKQSKRYRNLQRTESGAMHTALEVLFMIIIIEVVSLIEIFQRKSCEEAWNRDKTNEFRYLKEELSDVMICCM